jgi:putative ABC transport system ATP-binding protein
MIQLKDVTKSYGAESGVVAFKNITLTIGPAERVAVMGPSGSGKSTLLNLVCGLDEPTTGSVKVEGVELAGLSDDARTRLRREKIGMIFQTFNLLSTLTALENVALPMRLQGLSKKDAEGRATAMLGHVGLIRCPVASASGWLLRAH